jgi:hypothetical protein
MDASLYVPMCRKLAGSPEVILRYTNLNCTCKQTDDDISSYAVPNEWRIGITMLMLGIIAKPEKSP